ncbi:unnamed protein product [Caenorhabditis angaria]|uniref:Uncharacterized protein n=1 Tax=Caenorhabditis angaria TaxID=860376 RepID=A0A9P1MTV8_9PELO|nr:unnamed protein product [Caenorhabditis angaria]
MASTTYHRDDLTEEIFGHLCNVALTKCSDKFEKKKAGCGGRAMRKRVLIKNFVSDLFKMHKKPGSPSSSDGGAITDDDEEEEEEEDYEMSDVSFYEAGNDNDREEHIVEDVHLEDLSHNSFSNGDCWLSQADVYRQDLHHQHHHNSPTYYDYPTSSGSLYENVQHSSSGGPSTYSIYDIYSNVSEQATEGEIPSPSDPLASISSIMQPSEHQYDIYQNNGQTSDYFQTTTDDYFLTSNANNNDYTSLVCRGAEEEETHQLTDLDAETRESNKMKRRSTEMFDEFNSQFQKRIKI